MPLAPEAARAAEDGTVLAWGADMTGQLGDGGPSDGGGYLSQPAPVAVRWLGPTSEVVSASAGAAHSLALRRDGSVLAWGDDSYGQLGDGPGPAGSGNKASPVWVSGLGAGSGVVAVAAGGLQSLALKADGSVLSWGQGGQQVPVVVTGLGPGSGVMAVSAGYFGNLALRSDGSVVAWASGAAGPVMYGRPGSGAPVAVPGLEAGGHVVAVSAGWEHHLALRADGSVVAWGGDGSGQLGDDEAVADRATPVPVRGLGEGSGVVGVAAGYHHSLALRADGSVLSWGDDTTGQLGDGDVVEPRPTPGAVDGLGVGSGVVAVAAGVGHSLALRADGSVLSWGWDVHGQQGDGSPNASRTAPGPVRNLGPGSGIRAISAGGYHNLVAKVSPRTVSTFAPLSPARVFDSRSGPGPVGRIGAGRSRNVTIAGVGGVPSAGVTAVVLNVAAVHATAPTYVTVWPTGEPMPLASNLNVPAGDTRSNLVTVKVGASGQVSLFNEAGTVDLIADVAGWYGPNGGVRYTAVSPARIWDSRSGPGPTGRLGAAGTREITVAGTGGVPVGATAVSLNVTAVNPTATSFVTVWPTGEPRPQASNLNLRPGDTRANLVIVKLGAGGKVSVANHAGVVDLIADVAGYFRTAGANLTSVSPVRVWDTRTGTGPIGRLGPGGTRHVPVAGVGGSPPTGVSAVVLNVTAVNPTASTFVTVWPTGQPKPVTSNLNIPPGDTRANLVIVKVGVGGQVSFSNSAGTVDLVADVGGWYGPLLPSPPAPPLPPIPDAPPGSATTYQINAAHDGRSTSTLTLPNPAVPTWTHDFGQETNNVPQIQYALKVGGRVFVSVSRFSGAGADLHALDAETGRTLWGPVSLGDDIWEAGITADSQAVYASRNGVVSSFDQATGQVRWSTPLDASVGAPPTVANGLLYVSGSSYGSYLYALDTRYGIIRWNAQVPTAEASAVADGGVFTSSYGSAPNHRFAATLGTKIWSTPGSGGFGATTVVHGDSVYIPDVIPSAKRLAKDTGEALTPFQSLGVPAFHDGTGFFITSQEANGPWVLSAVNQTTGAVVWTATVAGKYATAPIVVDGKVIVGSTDGQVTALDERTGVTVWTGSAGWKIGGWWGPDSHNPVGLTAADGLLLVPSYDTLVAFGA